MAHKPFHQGKYYVTFKRGFEDCKKDITVTIEKLFETDCMKICLSDDEDPTFLCVITVSRLDYEELKKQQGLLIDFDNFPSQLVRLLQQCASNNMFLIMQQANPIQFYFEIVEHNEFKRLIHLSLKTGPATDSDIKNHMAETIINLKKMLAVIKSSLSSNEVIFNDKCLNMERKIHDLSHALTKMEEDKLRRESEYQETLKQEKDRLAQERLQWQKNAEMKVKVEGAAFQENINRKEKQIEDLNSVCKQLRDNVAQLDNQLSDKNQRLHLLEAEVQKSHIEVATLKAKNASLDRELMEKDKQCSQFNSRCMHLEKTVKEQSETIKDLTNSLQASKKEKITLEERLALSESLAVKSSEAAHSTSEQLLKANQIISKQNTDLIEMKEKLLCRTAIALEQEKVIERNTKEIQDLKSEISITKETLDKLKSDLDILKEKYQSKESELKDRDETIKNNNMVIQWLHKKMENHLPSDAQGSRSNFENPLAPSSTPYFLPRNNTNSSEGLSEESINFYATSKLSNIENSHKTDNDKSSRIGLDPKYLQPAMEDNQSKAKNKDTGRVKSSDHESLKGKENIGVELPKVDYREKKKTPRGNTYRATPISAYFP